MSARAWLAFAAVSVLWGIPYLFIRVAVDGGMPPIFLAWSRVAAAAVVVGMCSTGDRPVGRPDPLAWREE